MFSRADGDENNKIERWEFDTLITADFKNNNMFDDYVEDFFHYSEGRGAIDRHQAMAMVVDMMFEGDKEGVDKETVGKYVDEILQRRDAD